MTKTIIVMPAYYAEKTIAATIQNLPPVYEEIILCDDASKDQTFSTSQALGITTLQHKTNLGYGGNQKTLYRHALTRNPDVIIMVHPDNQYETKCIPEMIQLIESGNADLVLGNRMATARKNQMPLWRYIPNRTLSWFQNRTLKTNLAEFHSGLRAYNANIFKVMPFEKFSNDFSFDSEVIVWLAANHYKIGEVDTQCFYNQDVSSVSFSNSVKYGINTLKVLRDFKRGRYTKKDNEYKN